MHSRAGKRGVQPDSAGRANSAVTQHGCRVGGQKGSCKRLNPIASFAPALLALQIISATASFAGGPGIIDDAIWQGMAKCGPEPVYVTLSTELVGPKDGHVRLELADSPGSAPWALGYGRIYGGARKTYSMSVNWSFVAMDLYQRVGRIDRLNRVKLSDDGQRLVATIAIDAHHRCKDALSLGKMPAETANDRTLPAQAFLKEYRGTIGCYDRRPEFAVKLNLKQTGKSDFEGSLTFSPSGDRAGKDVGAFTVIGQFDDASGTLTLVGDQWTKKSLTMAKPFDASLKLKDRGERLIGQTSFGPCGANLPYALELYAPGADFARTIAMPATPPPITEWNTPSACVALIKWAGQTLQETGGKSPYSDMTVGLARKIAIGLFADERFVPFFGKPFAELTAAERKHVLDVVNSCRAQTLFADLIFESYAKGAAEEFFPDHKSTEWLKLKRFGVLRARLSKEMAALKAKNVGEADIPSLKATLAGLDERFAELWETDKAQAKKLLETKLDAAHGALLARLEGTINNLPDDWAAFDAEKGLRSEIASLGTSRVQDQARLQHILDAKLNAASDHILSKTAARFEKVEPSLTTLADLRSEIERQWLRVGRHVNTAVRGFKELQAVTSKFAKASFAELSTKAKVMIDSAAEFERRESQYGAVVSLYQRVVPSDRRFHTIFAEYAVIVDGLRPVPTKKDLVAADGSPTSFGLKLATSAWIERTWGTIFSALPYNISFITKSVRVSGLRKASCTGANGGGYWCNFHLQMSGSYPFIDLLSMVPTRARFGWQGAQWSLIEVGGNQQRRADIAQPYEETCGLVLGCTAGEIGANGVMAGLW